MCFNANLPQKDSSHEQYKADQATRDASIDQQNRNYTVQDINAMFGYYNPVDAPKQEWYQREATDPFPGYFGLVNHNYGDAAHEALMPPFTWDNDFKKTVNDAGPFDEAMQQWREHQAAAQKNAGAAKTARQEQYDNLLHDTVAFYTNDLNRQATDAARQQRFNVARRGVSGGSSDIDERQKLLQEYERGNVGVENRGQSAVNNIRGADEQARLDLISRVNSGLDANTAISSAQEAIRNALSQAQTDSTQNALGQIFTNFAQYYQPYQQQTQQNPGGGTASSYNANRPRYQGTVGSL